ncbi:MAG: hypothetical protein AVDCRST_MAG95-1431 [uncultured Adhaeribacter sp.]|uniref:Uncharacterized protein n=1 Tax=uncultured Adhaeribacter sp. TaxID=448109 RepID=A0A6J4I5L3_9BACT|nr:MAG: hypothetical protein AVDCRST_MAG95-1431 [uncultured Adhaeribacter sp.]
MPTFNLQLIKTEPEWCWLPATSAGVRTKKSGKIRPRIKH